MRFNSLLILIVGLFVSFEQSNAQTYSPTRLPSISPTAATSRTPDRKKYTPSPVPTPSITAKPIFSITGGGIIQPTLCDNFPDPRATPTGFNLNGELGELFDFDISVDDANGDPTFDGDITYTGDDGTIFVCKEDSIFGSTETKCGTFGCNINYDGNFNCKNEKSFEFGEVDLKNTLSCENFEDLSLELETKWENIKNNCKLSNGTCQSDTSIADGLLSCTFINGELTSTGCQFKKGSQKLSLTYDLEKDTFNISGECNPTPRTRCFFQISDQNGDTTYNGGLELPYCSFDYTKNPDGSETFGTNLGGCFTY